MLWPVNDKAIKLKNLSGFNSNPKSRRLSLVAEMSAVLPLASTLPALYREKLLTIGAEEKQAVDAQTAEYQQRILTREAKKKAIERLVKA